jgi:hypothetical protein
VPIYYLNLRQDEQFSRDLEGEEFDDLEHALREAAYWARELAASAVTKAEPVRGHVEITDGGGQTLASVSLRDTIRF